MPKYMPIFCVIILLCGTAVSQQPQFVEASQFLVGLSPLAVAAGDLNRDNKLDLVVTNKVDGTISVLLGNGDGTFKSKVDYSLVVNDTGAAPFTAAIADLNADGSLDVVVTLPSVNKVAVLIGVGDGKLQSSLYYDTGVGPQFVGAQDLNGDGKPDLVVSDFEVTPNPGNISVLINSGSGNFPTHVEYSTGNSPMGLAIAHFTKTTTWDVVVTNSVDGTISVMMGNGDGTFQPHQDLPVGAQPQIVSAADLNKDGTTDLIVGNFGDKTVSVLMGKGNGIFKSQRTYATAFEEPNGIAIEDFNEDGNLDLAISNAGSDSVSILLGKGDGSFAEHIDYWAGNGPAVLVAGDFDGDLHLDIAVPNAGWSTRPDNKMSLLIGNGDGTFRSHVLYETTMTPGAVGIGDLNGDGIPDLVVGEDPTVTVTAFCGCSKVTVLLGNPDGTYRSAAPYPTNLVPARIAVGDFDGDGALDVAAVNYGDSTSPGNTISILLGNGDGTLRPQVEYAVGSSPADIVIADFNRDGKLDLAVSNSADHTIGVLLGNGDGGFPSQIPELLSSGPFALATSDLNGDGIADLVVALPTINKIATLLGKGDGTFNDPVEFTSGTNPVSVAVGDYDHNGTPDVATANRGDGTITILGGNGDGTLQKLTSYSSVDPSSITAGDVNGDGLADVLVADQQDNLVNVFLGSGDGTFASPLAFGAGWLPAAVALSDLNTDGAADIVTANSNTGSVSVILNAGGTFVSFHSSATNLVYGQSVDLTTIVKASLPWKPEPSGDVNFLDENSVIGSATLTSGTATFSFTALSAGTHVLSARYLGDYSFQPHSTSVITQTVSQATTLTAIASSVNPSVTGHSVSFTATVSPQYSGTPGGAVTFMDGTSSLGSVNLANGTAVFSTSSLSAGTHNITANYPGDTNFTASISPVMVQVVNGQDFSMGASAITAPMHPGESASSILTLTSLYGFHGPVALTCSVTPTPAHAPTCSLNPTTVTPTDSGVTSTLTIGTAGKAAATLRSQGRRQSTPYYALLLPFVSLGVFTVGSGSWRKRGLRLAGLACLVLVALVFYVGCGGGGTSSTPNPPTPPSSATPSGTYTVTVTGTYGSGSTKLTHQASLNFEVQ